MNQVAQSDFFRQAAEAEGGMPISAGARVAHVRQAVEVGRAFFVDLTRVPEDKRPEVVAGINELVKRASVGTTQEGRVIVAE